MDTLWMAAEYVVCALLPVVVVAVLGWALEVTRREWCEPDVDVSVDLSEVA